MFWAFAASILILVLTITISNRGIVRIIGGVVLAAILIAALVQRLKSGADPEAERGKPVSPAAAVSAFPLAALQVEDLMLIGSGAPFELRGTITNSSVDTRLRTITVAIVRRECFEGALDPSGCAVMWQDQHWVRVDVPPQTERKFATSFYAHTTVPRGRGSVRDEFKVIAATGQPDAP